MSSSARLGLRLAAAALFAGGALSAQVAPGNVPPALAVAVAGAVAERWSADSARLRLEWGVTPTAAALSAVTPFRLLGKGTNGWLVALFEPPGKSPVAVRVRAGQLDSVLVAARPIGTAVALVAADIRRDARVRWGPPVPAAVEVGEGWVTRRPLNVGDLLTPAAALPPQLVRAGDAVRMEWQRGDVIVGLDGVALNSGAMGEIIRVRTAERGGQRTGHIVGPNAVRLDS